MLGRGSVAALLVLTVVGGWSTVSLANHGGPVDPVPDFAGVLGGLNANCAEVYPTATEFRINMPTDGTYSHDPDGPGGEPPTLTIAIDLYGTDDADVIGPRFDFNVISGPPIAAVAVKGGVNSQIYDYLGQSSFDVDPPADASVVADHGLHAPLNPENDKFFGVSHVSFCYDVATTSAATSGTKFNDLDGDGDRDAGEPGLAGVVINAYVDADGNDVLDADEITDPPAATDTTDAAGDYTLTVTPGDYLVCEVLPAGMTQTFPANTVCAAGTSDGLAPGGYAVSLGAGGDETGNDFGNRKTPTYGEDPGDSDPEGDPYGDDPGVGTDVDPYTEVTTTPTDTTTTGNTDPEDVTVVLSGETTRLDPVVNSEQETLAAAPGGTLPRTGAGLLGQAALALLLIGGGLIALAVGRRRPAPVA